MISNSDLNEIYIGTEETYKNLYQIYMEELRVISLQNKLIKIAKEITFLKTITEYNTDKLEIMSDKYNIEKIVYTSEEKEELELIKKTLNNTYESTTTYMEEFRYKFKGFESMFDKSQGYIYNVARYASFWILLFIFIKKVIL